MDIARLEPIGANAWELAPTGNMRVPAVVYADEPLLKAMDDKVLEQISNVATLPGIVGKAWVMPDAHWGYGFPIGGVAAFDAEQGGVVSGGGVGFDISCGVRLLTSPLPSRDVMTVQRPMAERLYETVPVGVGSHGTITLSDSEMVAMLTGGARWAVERGYGEARDLERIEEGGQMPGAEPEHVSEKARNRQRREMGTLGSGNHYLEVQRVAEIFDAEAARGFGLVPDQVVISIHCGSRGLGHQIGTEYLREMALAAPDHGIELPDRELACAPIASELGQRYLGAMRAGVNCALANREIITHLARQVFFEFFPDARLDVFFDVSHNTCKLEKHTIDGEERSLHVHRKGATRALAPGHPELPESLRPIGQPVLIGGSMAAGSYVLAGVPTAEAASLGSACHGAGRALSRHKAQKQWSGRQIQDELAARGIIVKCPSTRGIAEEAPGAYKDLTAVVAAAEKAGLAKRVARLEPLICIKG
jgi:tRNA-splicing ligase RtcB